MPNLTTQQVYDVNNASPVNREVSLGTILLALQQAGGLATGAVITDYLAVGVLSADAAGRAKMADGFFTSAELAKFADGLLTADATGRAKMADNFIVAAKITDATITAAKLVDPYLSDDGQRAVNVLYLPAACQDGETVTIGADVYEIDTDATVTGANIQLNVSAPTAVASQGTLTVDTIPTDGDTMTINGIVYRFKDIMLAANDIDIEGTLGECQTNIVAAINLSGTEGIEYYAGTVAATAVSAAAFGANASVITADTPGTAGNALATTETFTAVTNVFDAVTLGTTTAGVDPTAAEVVVAIAAAINASGTELVTAIDIDSATEVLIHADAAGVVVLGCTETLAGAGNVWAAAAMYGGAAAGQGRIQSQSRVPNATEATLGNLHFEFDFTPVEIIVQVRVTASGVPVAWVGAVTITAGLVTLDNTGAVDWSANDTVTVIALA